jgi:hypothetical protein
VTQSPRPPVASPKRKAPAAPTAKPASMAPGGVASALRLNLEEP